MDKYASFISPSFGKFYPIVDENPLIEYACKEKKMNDEKGEVSVKRARITKTKLTY
jgi:hypothetical protein